MSWFRIFFTLAVIGSPPAFAVEEHLAYETVVSQFENPVQCPGRPGMFWQVKAVETPLGTVPKSYPPFRSYHLRFSQFGCELGSKGALVVAPGRGESSVEYFETAIDFIHLGYSPVFVIDHRGQGLSPRLLADHHKGHIGDFADYVQDFAFATQKILKILEVEFSRSAQPVYFTSNSMGGAIGIGYFQSVGAQSPYEAAALLGPMIYVNYASFVSYKTEPLLKAALVNAGNKMEWLTNQIARKRCQKGLCEDYSSKTHTAYRPENLTFHPDTEALMTHSEQRFNIKKYFWNTVDWSAFARENYQSEPLTEPWSSVSLGGATNQYARETSRQNERMRTPTELRKMLDTPVLILTGTRDLRAYREYSKARQALRKLQGLPPTDLSRHEKFCADLNRIALQSLGQDTCWFVALEGAFHEIYKESDNYRDKAFQLVTDFFDGKTPEQ